MLTLAIPQSLPTARNKPLAVPHVGRENRRRQALRYRVLHRDRFVERRKGHDIENRRKGLPLDDGPLVLRSHDRRFHEISPADSAPDRRRGFPSRLLHLFEGPPIGLDRT